MTTRNPVRVAVIPGDGIGPDVVDSARRVIDAACGDIEWDEVQAGESALAACGSPLPQATLDTISSLGVALKGPCATPVGAGFRSVNVALRQEFDLYANVRPVCAFGGVSTHYPDLDLVVIRENTEGLYSSMEHWIGRDRQAAMAIGVNTRSAMERVSRFAFEYARATGRGQVTAVHKANIMKILSGLFLEVAREMATDYPDITFTDLIVDNMAMQMVLNPYQFEVIVTTNLFGDILSDLGAGLVGGLGLAPGANIGVSAAIFEAVHGTAPDIAGRDLADPVSVILAGALMLRHLDRTDAAARVEAAIRDVLRERIHVTPYIKPDSGVGTRGMTDAIVARVEALS